MHVLPDHPCFFLSLVIIFTGKCLLFICLFIYLFIYLFIFLFILVAFKLKTKKKRAKKGVGGQLQIQEIEEYDKEKAKN